MHNQRVIVVGTTPDYIDLLNNRFPGRVLFVTDPAQRDRADESGPDTSTELLIALDDIEDVRSALSAHLRKWQITPKGVVCFDCESLILAARLAKHYHLPYPSLESVILCRNKIQTKQRWQELGIPCPASRLIYDELDAVRFMNHLRSSVVLKPITGSGSELVFACRDEAECVAAVKTIKAMLARHKDFRMYPTENDCGESNLRTSLAAEELIEGPEFSCDFILKDNCAEIIRVAKKIPAAGHSLGTMLAYLLPSELPSSITRKALCRLLFNAAQAIGLSRSVCMADFIISKNQVKLLEITPRPGGDCLPQLIMKSSGFDILGASLDLAEGRSVDVPSLLKWKQFAALRLFAAHSGIIRAIDDKALRRDERVVECLVIRCPGHRVILPPENYDSRFIGYVVFKPDAVDEITSECTDLISKLVLDMETLH